MQKLFLIVIFNCFCIQYNCFGESSETIIIEAPPEVYQTKKPYKIYWNVPTMQCRSKGIPFKNLYEKYGIIQNRNDDFIGNEIAILYDPGLFPAIFKNDSHFFKRNGGVPQEGDLTNHLTLFEKLIKEHVGRDFGGVLIINFESWRPIFRQNFGVLSPYKDMSYSVEKERHWLWPDSWVKQEASRRFEESGRVFMEATIDLAKRLVNNSIVGYYAYPYCYNMSPNNLKSECARGVPKENDRISWLWRDSTALLPSVYLFESYSDQQQRSLITGRISETKRVRNGGTKIFPYLWFKYRDGGFITKDQLKLAFKTLYNSGTDGVIIWGSSNDVNTKAKCLQLYDYVEKVLGPTVAAYSQMQDQELLYEAIQEYKPAVQNDGLKTKITVLIQIFLSFYLILMNQRSLI